MLTVGLQDERSSRSTRQDTDPQREDVSQCPQSPHSAHFSGGGWCTPSLTLPLNGGSSGVSAQPVTDCPRGAPEWPRPPWQLESPT